MRLYLAEDLPQMDPEYFEKFKKILNISSVTKDLVDPYCLVSFAGHSGKTVTVQNSYNPEWNQQINMPIRVFLNQHT